MKGIRRVCVSFPVWHWSYSKPAYELSLAMFSVSVDMIADVARDEGWLDKASWHWQASSGKVTDGSAYLTATGVWGDYSESTNLSPNRALA